MALIWGKERQKGQEFKPELFYLYDSTLEEKKTAENWGVVQ